MDGNEAAAYVAHKTNEIIAIYPITPASPMGELSDQWSAMGVKNIWGTVPSIMEMQSEGGASGAVHGALQAGALTTTFTASQGLLLMLPNMYKIAGELTSTVFHISARSLAIHALSIFADHSDVMAARATGWGMLFSASVQEVMDMALIAQAISLESRIPFLHVFDGFRTSHEIQKIVQLSDDEIKSMIDEDLVKAHRDRKMSPDKPFIRGTSQNPDVYFQAREASSPYYDKAAGIVQKTMDKFSEVSGRTYNLFDYVGAPDADRVIILMASACETAEETVKYLVDQGEKVGLIKIRLFRPFSVAHLMKALPSTVKAIGALDRTKEPGAVGDPIYQDIITAIAEGLSTGAAPFDSFPKVIAGRYGLSSKEFTPAMVKSIFEELAKPEPKNHFTVGINDDVSHSSLDYDPIFDIEPDNVTRGVFWGLGSDGTVGANKNSVKIIGEETDFYAQGYFVYDSKKSGARTVSHLRFGPDPIRSTYLIKKANFVAVHQFGFLESYDTLAMAQEGATFLLNSVYGVEEVWGKLPRTVQEAIINKKLTFYVIDAYAVAKKAKMGVRINTIMQTCFFALSGVLPKDEAIVKIKEAIKKTYGKLGDKVIQMNYAAVDAALDHLHEVKVPDTVTSAIELPPIVAAEAPEFVQKVTATIIADKGDDLPVSAFSVDGTFPSGTTQWEKRNVCMEVPVWDESICIQCGKCVLVCPHACIRAKLVDEADLTDAPESFKSTEARFKKDLPGKKYCLQVAVEDCTGCHLCVETCPAKNKAQPGLKALNMTEQLPIRVQERENWKFFLTLPDVTESKAGSQLDFSKVKNNQLLEPLFEFSGACAGCGETPYLKVLTQLSGDRTIMANATGCSSIYGGNLPTTPYTFNKHGRGPAWINSLFEDNAELGLGLCLTLDKHFEYANELTARLRDVIGEELADSILNADQTDKIGIAAQRVRVAELKKKLVGREDIPSCHLLDLADVLVKKVVWIIGGDGWAYDIGYGGLDHVIASGRNVNLLVLDTEVYSNTGGQASKATSMGAVAKFAAGGKPTPKKDLGALAMSYGYVYVAQIAMGANDAQTIKALMEAEAFDGPSIIIAYSHCIAHGIDLSKGLDQQKLAVDSGYWPLYRFNPSLKGKGKNPLVIDSKDPKIQLKDYVYNENRYRMLLKTNPEAAAKLLKGAQETVDERWRKLKHLSKFDV